jgi:hypothetical protein
VCSKTMGEVCLDDEKINIFQRSARRCHWVGDTGAPCRGHYGQALQLHLAYEGAIEQYKELFNAHHIDRKEEFG